MIRSFPRCTAVRLLLALILITSAFAVRSVERIKVMALFPDRAMLQLDGVNRLLKAGEASPEGVRLISATPHEAVIEYAGERRSYALGSSIDSSYRERERQEVTIWRDSGNAYNTIGSINGQNVDMVVDTGATSVAMSEQVARRLGLQYQIEGDKIAVQTASGVVQGYRVDLDRVQLGAISLTNVEGVVISGNSPSRVLLGMSFLNRVEMENRADMLILRSK